GTQDEQIWRENHIENCYRLPDDMTGMRVLDIGAHIGIFAIECLKRGAARVTCVEPFGPNCDFLRRNLQAWESRVTILPVAVAAPGVKQVLIRASLNHPHYTGEPHVADDGVAVEARDLDDLICFAGSGVGTITLPHPATWNLDFLKMDCEGGEAQILNAR